MILISSRVARCESECDRSDLAKLSSNWAGSNGFTSLFNMFYVVWCLLCEQAMANFLSKSDTKYQYILMNECS